MQKKKLPGEVYYLVGACFLVIVAATLVPLASDKANTLIYSKEGLTIIYAFISLLVTIVLFGVIGDSEAIIQSNNHLGFVIQISGSAAGFTIFFYLLSSGITPYSQLTVYFQKGQNQLISENDGSIEVVLASNEARRKVVQKGSVEFAYLPRSEVRRIYIESSRWDVSAISPSSCDKGGFELDKTCTIVSITLKEKAKHIGDIRSVQYERTAIATTLDTFIPRFAERIKDPDAPIYVKISNELRTSGLADLEFKLHRKNESERKTCEHLAEIENAFNKSVKKEVIKILINHNTIFVTSSDASLPGKDFVPCVTY